MKLQKQNPQGSISVIIPYNIVNSVKWHVGDDVIFIPTEDPEKLIIQRVLKKED